MTANIVNIIHSFVDYPHPAEDCITVFLSGCGHNCKFCHNESIQDISKGKQYTPESLIVELKTLSVRYKTNNIVLQGGDPLFGSNLDFTRYLICNSTDLNFCIYTGYSINYVKKYFNKEDAAYWKCGLYDVKKKMISGKTDESFSLGSSNQDFFNTNFKKISKNGVLKF